MKKFVSFKERIKENFKKNKVLLFVFIAIWIVTVVITYNHYINTLGKESYGADSVSDVVEIDSNTTISQVLSVDNDTDTISLKYATYARNNKGKINIKVTGLTSKNIYLDKTVNISNLQDNAYATYSLTSSLKSSKEKNIKIDISSDSKTGSAVGLYFTDEPFFESSSLKINGEDSELELATRYLLVNDNYDIFYKIALYSSIIVISLLVLVLVLINPKKEVMFVIMAAVYGLSLMMVISPGAVPDELLHYEKALQISNVTMFEKADEIDEAYLNYNSFGDHVNVAYSYNRFIEEMPKPLKLKNKKVDFTYSLEDGYIAYYVPQSIGITIARLLKANTLKTFYAGRFSNFIFYLICVYIALKNTPTNKMLLGVIANLPMFVQQGASYSYDTFINGLILISISYLFKWFFVDEKISKKDYIIVLIVSVLLAPAKIIYGIFTILFWFVPANRFASKKQKIISISLLCLPMALLVLYNVYLRTISMLMDGWYDKTANLVLLDPKEAVAYVGDDDWQLFNIFFILKHPILTIEIILRSIRFYLSTWFYQSLGRTLVGSDLVMPMTLIRIVLVCISITALRKEPYTLPISMKIAFVVTCLAVGFLVLIMMLTGWTNRGDILIKGVQGRYFCPLLPYFFTVITNSKIQLPKKLDKYVLFTLLIVNFQTIIYVLSYTFVN